MLGAQHVIKSALHTGVETIVNVSTDKASMPVLVMGATKLLTERLFNAGNVYSGRKGTWYASATCSIQPGRSRACSTDRSQRGDR